MNSLNLCLPATKHKQRAGCNTLVFCSCSPIAHCYPHALPWSSGTCCLHGVPANRTPNNQQKRVEHLLKLLSQIYSSNQSSAMLAPTICDWGVHRSIFVDTQACKPFVFKFTLALTIFQRPHLNETIGLCNVVLFSSRHKCTVSLNLAILKDMLEAKMMLLKDF